MHAAKTLKIYPLKNAKIHKHFDDYLRRVKSLAPLLDQKQFTLKTIQVIRVHGRELQGIEVCCEKEPSVQLYFDKETSLLTKTVFQSRGNCVEELLGDYRDVNGLKLPFSLKISQLGRQFSDEKTITQIEVLNQSKSNDTHLNNPK